MKLGNKGFTLIELLAIITILGVVTSIASYTVINTINNVKEKGYEVTLNEIEKNANTYVLEKSNELFFVSNGADSELEHQCLTIKTLIDMGYLKDDITESYISATETVNQDNYVYLERNAKTKAITKSIYTESNNGTCTIANNVKGDIVIESNPALSEWSREKELTITYKLSYKKSNINDYNTNYTYNSTHTVDSNYKSEKAITVTATGTLGASITDSDNIVLVSKSVPVLKIDRETPSITTATYATGSYQDKATFSVSITDALSGVNYSTVSKEDFIVTIGTTTVSSDKITFSRRDGNIYDIIIDGDGNNGTLSISIASDTISDNAGNTNGAVSLETGIVFNSSYIVTFDVNGGNDWNASTCVGDGMIFNSTDKTCKKEVRNGEQYGVLPNQRGHWYGRGLCYWYNFIGWYTGQNGAGIKITDATIVNLNADQTLYAYYVGDGYNYCSTPEPSSSSYTPPPSSSTYTPPPSSSTSSNTCPEPINGTRCNTCTHKKVYISCCETPTVCNGISRSCLASENATECNPQPSSSTPAQVTCYKCNSNNGTVISTTTTSCPSGYSTTMPTNCCNSWNFLSCGGRSDFSCTEKQAIMYRTCDGKEEYKCDSSAGTNNQCGLKLSCGQCIKDSDCQNNGKTGSCIKKGCTNNALGQYDCCMLDNNTCN